EAFVFVNDESNMPLAAAAIERAEIDTVLTTYGDALAFSAYLNDQNRTPPRNWIVLIDAAHAAHAIAAPLERPNVAYEVHAFPGVPVLVQCPELAARGPVRFHAEASFLADHTTDAALITSAADEPFPLLRYRLPFQLRASGACGCGEKILEVV